MKLLTACIFLAIASLHCILTTAAATVGLYAPDRYDGIPEMCLMPMDYGYCRAKVKRYYFDMRRMKCSMFYFGGCAGNINNFKSLEECNKICLDSYEEDVNASDGVDDGSGIKYTSRSGSSSPNTGSTKNNTSSDGAGAGASAGAGIASTYKSSKYGNFGKSKNIIQNRNDDNSSDYYDDSTN